jgi:hypothetical protein
VVYLAVEQFHDEHDIFLFREADDSFQPPSSWTDVKSGKPKGIIAEILAAQPSLPGSNDMTVVTVRDDGRCVSPGERR